MRMSGSSSDCRTENRTGNGIRTMSREVIGAGQSDEQAAELYEEACRGGSAEGCNNLGFMFQHGHGAALAAEEALPLPEELGEEERRGIEIYRRAAQIERALDRYARGGISFGAAAGRAGVSQSELARHAYARGMEPPFSGETLAEEVG